MEFYLKTFEELSLNELYEILRLRVEVFVVEQNCPYQDIDGFDRESIHILGKVERELIAYARIFQPGIYHKKASAGRYIVKKPHRGKAYGHQLVNESIKAVHRNFGKQKIHISAQRHLTDFYAQHGFSEVGEGYLEDGIPHIGMEVKPGGFLL